MKANSRKVRAGQRWPAHIVRTVSFAVPRRSLILLAVLVAATFCAANAQTLIGSPGAGWQTWNLDVDSNSDFIDLNSNGFPYWDVQFLTFNNGGTVGYGGNPANKSVGWCMTSTGDCQGFGSALTAPGPLPFWGMTYNAAADTGGAIDPKMYFRTVRAGQSYQATLYLNTATNNREINEFGWFETNSTGTINGTEHVIFQGSGFPPGTLVPDPIGKVVNFTPTQYYGFYYQDVSDEEDLNGPPHGCWAYTIFNFNDEDCTAAGTPANGPGQGDHNFAIFLQQSAGGVPTYWVAGQDPSMCSQDGDCNLTVVKVRRLSTGN
jgi:hypothetical protein